MKSNKYATFVLLGLVAQANAGDVPICNEDDLRVEFSECDTLGRTRNGKNTKQLNNRLLMTGVLTL